MDQTKIDCLPTIEQVIGISEMYGNRVFSEDFNRDQKPDFYLGMIAASRMFVSYLKHYEKNKDWETLEDLEKRLHMLNSDVAKIIVDKYDLKNFKP